MTDDLEKVKADIIRAREWAWEHFNADQEEDHILAKPTFDMEYPEPDEIEVWPRSYGRRLFPSLRYKLAWKPGGQLVWVSQRPFYGIELVIGSESVQTEWERVTRR